jgi:bifunctional DNA-binding transcriptional regulator/antitoxin component of YhaV-PrlF toxin-antitoxin module
MKKQRKYSFHGNQKVQGARRISIPETLLRNLDLEIGDLCALYHNPETGEIIIKKEEELKNVKRTSK